MAPCTAGAISTGPEVVPKKAEPWRSPRLLNKPRKQFMEVLERRRGEKKKAP